MMEPGDQQRSPRDGSPTAGRPAWVWLRVGLAVLVLAAVWLTLNVIGSAVKEAVRAVRPGAGAVSGP